MIAYVTIMSAFLGASAQSSDRFLSMPGLPESYKECQKECWAPYPRGIGCAAANITIFSNCLGTCKSSHLDVASRKSEDAIDRKGCDALRKKCTSLDCATFANPIAPPDYNTASSTSEEDSFDCRTDCNNLSETDCRATSANAQGCDVMYLHRKFHTCLPCEAEFPACESVVDGDECFRFNCPYSVENGDFKECLADDKVSRECYPQQQFTSAAILSGSYVENLEECLEMCHRVYGSGCQSVAAVNGTFDGLRCRLLSDSIQGKQNLLTSVYGDDGEAYFADDEEPNTSVHCELK